MATIAVIGGGFGGTYALFELERRLGREHKLLLFEPRDRFVFTPLLHEVAGGVLNVNSVTVPYRELFRRVQHVKERVARIDLAHKYLLADKRYAFDYVIIAPGAKTNFYGKRLPTLELKTFADALKVRATIEQNVQRAVMALSATTHTDVQPLLTVVIVGGGATGVEVAGEAVDLLRFRLQKEGLRGYAPRVVLVHSQPKLLHQFDPFFHDAALARLRKKGVEVILGAKVTGINKRTVTLEEKASRKQRTVASDCIIWTAGIAPNAIPPSNSHLATLPTLQVERYPYAFAVGDASRVNGGQYPALAQVATKQGAHAAHNIIQLMLGRDAVPFSFTQSGALVSVGQKYAVGRVLGLPIKGFVAWFLMRTVYLFKFHSTRQWFRTASEYTIRLFRRDERCVRRIA